MVVEAESPVGYHGSEVSQRAARGVGSRIFIYMATANAATTTAAAAAAGETSPGGGGGGEMEDMTAKAANKRYQGLVTVRSKAIKGKGAWYWAHLEPILLSNADTGRPKAVKLRCSLCSATFSASNPSRTASEHLKRGTCPNFSSPAAGAGAATVPAQPSPVRPISPLSSPPPPRKRPSSAVTPLPLAVVDPSRFCPPDAAAPYSIMAPPLPLVLSGGKEDLGALAMLEDSVKRLKSPKTSPGPALGRAQADAAIGLLADWLYESGGAVSLSSLDHPKFVAFLAQVGLPPLSRRDLAGPRLDARFHDALTDADAKIRDAKFFQLASDGWSSTSGAGAGDKLVTLTVNLPNGTSVFRRTIFVAANRPPSDYAEEVFRETVAGICGPASEKCVGIVSDKYKGKALRSLEREQHWMVNLPCQLQAVMSLIKDLGRELPLFKSVAGNCHKLCNLFNTFPVIMPTFHRYQLQELEHSALLRSSPPDAAGEDFMSVFWMVEDVISWARLLQLTLADEACKSACDEDAVAGEVREMVRDVGFWTELEAVHSLVKLLRSTAAEVEAERPLVGQCLPLWEELRGKLKDWCGKFNVAEGPVEKIVERRFRKNYHPAWAAAFILDPLYLIRDSSGKYLPPFKCLTPDQEKDVDKLITRLVSREEAHIAVMELMKWRSEGLDPLYAQAVQVKQRDPTTGKLKIANPQSSRLVWETCLSEFKALGKVAVRLIFLHATACGFKCNWSLLRCAYGHGHSRAGAERVQKMIFIAANAKLDRRDFSNEEDKDLELFANGESSDHVLSEVFVDAPAPPM